jgi:Zn-dependent peptidase ImmA (M78 family)/plasmid maintenance system antidote protein VapI
MKTSEIIGKNIEKLMMSQNISYRQMAEVINVTHPTVSKYIKGDQVIDSEKLSIIATYFNKSFDYFFSIEHDEIGLLFRADKPDVALEESDIKMIKTKFNQYIDIVGNSRFNFIPQKYNLLVDSRKLNEEDESFLEKVAFEQRKFFNVENVIPENYFAIVEEKGINVISTKFLNESFFGASSFSEKFGSFIFVNSYEKISEERQIFTLFHEFGHLLFHQSDYKKSDYNPYYGGTGDIKEKIVNSFAGYFLLPRNLVKEYIDSRGKNVDIIEMKQYFKVSIQTLYIALKNYNYISQKQYSEFWKKVNMNDWKKNEPKPIDITDLNDKNYKLSSNLKKLYSNDEISANKVSQVLDIDLIETRKLLKKWSDADEQYEHLS